MVMLIRQAIKHRPEIMAHNDGKLLVRCVVASRISESPYLALWTSSYHLHEPVKMCFWSLAFIKASDDSDGKVQIVCSS